MAKRYGRKRTKAGKKGHRKHKRTGRKAAGKRLARYNKLRHSLGKKRAHALVFGKGHKGRKAHRKTRHRVRGRKGRKAAGHKLARFNRLRHQIGKRAAHAQVYGRAA